MKFDTVEIGGQKYYKSEDVLSEIKKINDNTVELLKRYAEAEKAHKAETERKDHIHAKTVIELLVAKEKLIKAYEDVEEIEELQAETVRKYGRKLRRTMRLNKRIGELETLLDETLEEIEPREVAYNDCEGSFRLSKEAVILLKAKKKARGCDSADMISTTDGIIYTGYIPRHDPDLIDVIQELGTKAASGSDAKVRTISVSDRYYIESHHGDETILEPCDIDWE